MSCHLINVKKSTKLLRYVRFAKLPTYLRNKTRCDTDTLLACICYHGVGPQLLKQKCHHCNKKLAHLLFDYGII